MTSPHIHITGAGVVGLCLANELRRRDLSVSIHDIAPDIPGPASCAWWAGGMLAPWCERESAEEPVFRHGQQAADWWQSMQVPVTRNGSLVVALDRDRKELDRFNRLVPGGQWLNQQDLQHIESDLADRFAKSQFFADEAHINPRQALQTLTDKLTRQGVIIGKEKKNADIHVDCRGFAAKDILPDLRGVKGEMLILRCPDLALSRPVRLLHPRHPLYIVPRGDGVYMLGATMIESEDRHRITARSMMELLNAAWALHPAFGEAEILEIGVDLRPAFADNIPRIRQTGDHEYAINGLFRHGFLLSPALAVILADHLDPKISGKDIKDEAICEW